MQAESQRLRLGAQRFQLGNVFEHRARLDVLLVRHREDAPVTLGGCQSDGFPFALNQHLPQPIRPRRRRLGDALFDD